jgi:aerobic carbon-monoxide dehydrogenase medium subunit
VRPAVFNYRDPRSLDEALDLLREIGSDAAILAGGQSLMPLLNMRLAVPEVVVDINRVAGLDDVAVEAGTVRIGSMARARTVERDKATSSVLPVLIEALQQVAHPQIRNRTTIGGSIAHADPSSELPGVLAALDGSVTLTSSTRVRTVGWDDFFISVFTTSREPDELVTAVSFPVLEDFRFRFDEFARRKGEYPIVGLCAGTALDNGRIVGARMAAIGVGTVPMRLRRAESALLDAQMDDVKAHEAAAEVAAQEVDPPQDVHASTAFRRGLLSTLVRRALRSLAQGAAHEG